MWAKQQKYLLLVLALLPLSWALESKELEPLQRQKRALTTICVEIKPSGPQEEPYFMCKGTEFPRGSAVAPQAQPEQLPPPASYANYQQHAFPGYGGFFPQQLSPPPPAPASSYSQQSHQSTASASGAQPYGLPAISYATAGGAAAAAHGTAASPSATATPTTYADAAPTKPSPSPQSYESVVGSRHQPGMDVDLMQLPNVGFRPEELQRPEPFVGAAWPQAMPQARQDYLDDPIMRTFYASLEPQVEQAVAMPHAAPLEAAEPPALAQQPPSYAPTTAPAAAPVMPLDSSGCNSCQRSCADASNGYAAPAAAPCPSYQPVIIAMPCYGQQQPTHYLAVPNSAPREQLVGAPWALGMGMQQAQQPQLGAAYGMNPQVGAPFGLGPLMNPFGAFGHLNPFNPFNRMLGAANPQPGLRLFGKAFEPSTSTEAAMPKPTTTPMMLGAAAATTTTSKPAATSTTEGSVGAAFDAGEDSAEQDAEDAEADEDDATETANASTTEDAEDASKSVEAKGATVEQMISKSESKLKQDKRKRHNSRYSSNNPQKRKYLQRL